MTAKSTSHMPLRGRGGKHMILVGRAVGALLLGLLFGVGLLGATESPSQRGTSDVSAPAQQVPTNLQEHPSPEAAALAHAREERPDLTERHAELVFQFPDAPLSEVRVRVTAEAFCRIYTAKTLLSGSTWVSFGPGTDCRG